MTWLVVGMAILAATLSVPAILELTLLTVGSLRVPRPRPRPIPDGFHLGVVVPAHNEEQHVARAVRSILDADQGGLTVSVIVVADNCQDRTAAIALTSGARVVVRHDAVHRGKGFALNVGFDRLLADGADAILVIDADTVVDRNLLTEAAAAFAAGADAVQSRYLVRNVDSPRTRLMQLALMAFNVARPRGREAWGLSCGIFGNGFGVSRDTLTTVGHAATSVVEDLEYHLQLVRAGRRVRFLDRTTVRAEMPSGAAAAVTQRSRWEGGRARLLREVGPRLLADVASGRWQMVEPLLDLLLPPLGFFAAVMALLIAVPYPPTQIVGALGGAVLAVHVGVAIRVGGGGWAEIRTLALAPAYVLWKVAMLGRIVSASQRDAAWVRTPREVIGRSRS